MTCMASPLVLLPFNDADLVLFWGSFTFFCVLSASLGFYFARRLSNHPGRGKDRSDSELQALATLFVPTCSGTLLELRSYPLVKSISAKNRSKEITLSFKALYDLICNGIIELRQDTVLDGLMTGQLQTNGCKFSVEVPGNNRWQAICWILQSYFRNQRLGWPESESNMIDLDFIPYSGLKKCIAVIADGPEQQFFTLCLTCLSPDVSFLGYKFPFTVLPLLPKVYHPPTGKIRTTTPLFLSLQSVLKLLASNHPHLTVVKVANISSSYAEILQEIEKALVDDRILRTNYIREYGLTGWREQRLRLIWEANLLRQGRLQRWKVTLCS